MLAGAVHSLCTSPELTGLTLINNWVWSGAIMRSTTFFFLLLLCLYSTSLQRRERGQRKRLRESLVCSCWTRFDFQTRQSLITSRFSRYSQIIWCGGGLS